MQQLNGSVPNTATPSPVPTTGPGVELTTIHPNHRQIPQARAVVTMTVTHDQVTIHAQLAMGRETSVMQRWQRRRGRGKGWWRVEGIPSLAAAGDAVSPELAAWLDRMGFPYEVANMLPRAASAACSASIDAAAQELEVAR